jgi:hypothetical protein
MLVAAGAYIPEESFFSADLSLPKYTVDNNADLVKPDGDNKKPAAPARQVAIRMKKSLNAGTDKESPAARERRLEKEATFLAKAQVEAARAAAKEDIVMQRKMVDFEKAQAMKAERQAIQAKRLEQIGKVAKLTE